MMQWQCRYQEHGCGQYPPMSSVCSIYLSRTNITPIQVLPPNSRLAVEAGLETGMQPEPETSRIPKCTCGRCRLQ